MRTWLLDTGPIVAYLDRNDPAHARVASRLDGFSGRLATTSAVVTEAMHFVASARRGPALLADWVTGTGTEVFDLCRPPELHEVVALMDKYSDLPMDFADGTLVLLAEALETDEVCSLDRRGFSVFRTRAGRALSLVLDA